MGNILGKEKPLKEVMRENKRTITRAIRELDREKVGLEKEEKRLTMEIKKAARENQMQSVKIMAKVSHGRNEMENGFHSLFSSRHESQ
jgi:charged multivesicular body protein 2A